MQLGKTPGYPGIDFYFIGGGWGNIPGFMVLRPKLTTDTHLRSGVPFSFFFRKKRTSDRRFTLSPVSHLGSPILSSVQKWRMINSPDMRGWRYTGRIVIAVVSGWAKRNKSLEYKYFTTSVQRWTTNCLILILPNQSVILFSSRFSLLQNQTLLFSTPLRTKKNLSNLRTFAGKFSDWFFFS